MNNPLRYTDPTGLEDVDEDPFDDPDDPENGGAEEDISGNDADEAVTKVKYTVEDVEAALKFLAAAKNGLLSLLGAGVTHTAVEAMKYENQSKAIIEDAIPKHKQIGENNLTTLNAICDAMKPSKEKEDCYDNAYKELKTFTENYVDYFEDLDVHGFIVEKK